MTKTTSLRGNLGYLIVNNELHYKGVNRKLKVLFYLIMITVCFRCVDDDLRSFSLGVQMVFVRTCGELLVIMYISVFPILFLHFVPDNM